MYKTTATFLLMLNEILLVKLLYIIYFIIFNYNNILYQNYYTFLKK